MTGRNPVLPPDVCIPDGEARAMPDGRLYVYGSYDQHDDVLCSTEYRVVSTKDLSEWTVHDVSFAVDAAPLRDEAAAETPVATLGRWTKLKHLVKTLRNVRKAGVWPAFRRMMAATRDIPGPLLFAPDCVEKDGRYYLYFGLSDGSEGVAVGERPEGPFTGPVRLPATGIDPAVFVDDNGAAYYYWGQFRASGVRLDDGMRGFDTATVRHNLVTDEQHHFHEGSSMRKIGDTYYLVFADTSRGKPTCLGYATGSSPLGPFDYHGVIIDNDGCDPNSWNNHGSIERFGNDWFVFYHRSSGNSPARRRLCVEPIKIAADGTIAEVPMTSQGAAAPYARNELIEAWRACAVSGGAYVGPAEGDERLILPKPGASGTYRYLSSDGPLSRASIDVIGSGVIEVRVGGHVTESTVANGTQIIELGLIPAGLHDVAVTLRAGENVHVRGIVFS